MFRLNSRIICGKNLENSICEREDIKLANLEKYNEVFKGVFSVEENVLNDNFTFEKIESWDSMAHLSLISALEDAFEIMLETEDILHFGGYENGKKILSKYGVSF